jgi:hypothetical protein
MRGLFPLHIASSGRSNSPQNMKRPESWPLTRSRLLWIGAFASCLAIGFVIGSFFSYATGIERPIFETPIPVDFCSWVSHPEFFRGQPVQTEATYTQLTEAGAIDSDECLDLDISSYWAQTNDSVRDAWEKDLQSNFFTAKFQLSFVGTIPAHPRYFYWLADLRNHWQRIHKITVFRVDRLTSFKRIR